MKTKLLAAILFLATLEAPLTFAWPWSKSPEQKLAAALFTDFNTNRHKYLIQFILSEPRLA